MDYSALIAKRRERLAELEEAIADPDLSPTPNAPPTPCVSTAGWEKPFPSGTTSNPFAANWLKTSFLQKATTPISRPWPARKPLFSRPVSRGFPQTSDSACSPPTPTKNAMPLWKSVPVPAVTRLRFSWPS